MDGEVNEAPELHHQFENIWESRTLYEMTVGVPRGVNTSPVGTNRSPAGVQYSTY